MGNEQLEAGNIAGERTCWRKSSSAVNWAEWEAMFSPRLVKEVLKALGKAAGLTDGRLDSVSLYSGGPTADFPELDTRLARRRLRSARKPVRTQSRSKEGEREEIDLVLKQKLFELRSRKRMRGTAEADFSH